MPEDPMDPMENGTKDPTEFDPCVEDPQGRKDPKGKRKNKRNDPQEKRDPNVNFFERYTDLVSDKSGLSQNGVYVVGGVVILLVLSLVVVMALAIAWPRVPHRFQYPVCGTPECLWAAAQIRESVNSSVSPCENLWTSVCGGWLRKYPLPPDRVVWNQKRQLMRREAVHVRDLISTLKQPLHIGTVERKLKLFYETCNDMENINGDKATPLIEIINELGGWHILRNWNEEDFDMNKLLQKLHEKFGVSSFFKISVGPNPNSPGHNAIRISPAGLGLPDREYYYMDEEERIQVAYKEFIRDVIIYLSTTRNQATKFGTDIFSYEKRIAEITPDTKNLQNPITTYNAISLSELKATNLIPFFDIVQSMYPDTNITDSTEVIVTSLDYLGHIAQIISTTDRKTMNGYLIWTLVREYIPYLSNTFTSTVDTFKSELYGFQQPMERWEICSNLVRKFMGYATEVLQTKLSPVTEEDQEVIREIFNSIVNVVNEKIEGLKKSVLLYNHLKSKLQHLRLQIGLPEQFKKDNFLKEYYTPLMILKANFFDSIVHTVKFQRKIEQAMLNKRPTEEIQQWFTSGEEEPVVQYSPSDHAIIIPRSLLTEPLFNCNYSSSVLYGRLGVEISEAVVSSILPYGSLWTSDRKILSPYHTTVNDSIKSVRKLTKCMADLNLNLNLEVKLRTANETALKMAVHLTGVDVAKEALLLHLQKVEHAEHVHQPSLEEYEEPALFFLTYAQTQCSKSTSQYRLYNNIVNFELPQDARLHIIWSQIEDFSKSLDCSHNKKLQCPKIF